MKLKRFLIPFSMAGFVVPFIRPEFTNLLGVGISYFISSYIVLWNFPEISKSMSSEPLYLKDLADSPYENNFVHIMNFTLACLFGLIADYGIIKGIMDKTLIEVLAIIGGNMALFSKIETSIGKVMLYLCHACKVRSERKRKLSDVGQNNLDMTVVVSEN
tara:strand:- start:421 stop:900 length:480 start_codon:yes stop_codon:yes gene_type:complete